MTHKILLNTLIATAFLLASNGVFAKDYQLGDIKISTPWARASAGPAKTGAAYIVKISNTGTKIDRLIGVAGSIAKRVETHTNIIENNIAKMRHVNAIDIHPGHSTSLKPGGYHIMMMGLHAPLKVGQTFPLTLTFEKAGKIEVTVEVRKIGAGRKMKMDHGKMKH